MNKRLISLAISASLALTCAPMAFAANAPEFKRTRTYEATTFSDVPSSQWYAEWVKNAYELGLVNGKGGDKFDPEGNITIAETIAIACNINAIYTGKESPVSGEPWYINYVDYAIANGIIKDGTYASYTVPATRAQFAEIMAACLPADTFVKINDVTSIPDVDKSASYATAVYTLYNAGITKGGDAYGTYNPNDNIQRSAVSVIAAKVAASSLRETFTLTPQVNQTCATLGHDYQVSGTQTIHHDAEGYYRTIAATYRTVTQITCSFCGAVFYNATDWHAHRNNQHSGSTIGYAQVVDVPEHQEWFQVSDAYDETVTTYTCSRCGASYTE